MTTKNAKDNFTYIYRYSYRHNILIKLFLITTNDHKERNGQLYIYL